jgi:hypothetical protein
MGRRVVSRAAFGGSRTCPKAGSNPIDWGAAAPFELPRLQLDIEASEEPGDALIGEAALAQDLDLASEHVDYLVASKSRFNNACSLAKLTSCCDDLVSGVGALGCHSISPDVSYE